MKNTVTQNLEIIRNSKKFIELNGVLPLEQVEDLIIGVLTIKTQNFSNGVDYPSEVEKIAKMFS